MATNTTSTTDNNAGCSPCTPEAHQRSVFQSRVMMEDIHKKVVPDEFDLEESTRRLAIYIREHAVPMTHSPKILKGKSVDIRAKLDEAEQIITCHGCVNLDTADCESGVGWCNFHWQYRSIGTPRTCEGVQFFNQEEL